jgi:hypothetical protein
MIGENEMKQVNFAKAMDQVKFHTRIVVRGFARMIYGTLVAGLLAVAIYGFAMVGSESGYIAVCDFIASCATLVVALCNMYVMGKKGRGRK